MRHLKDIGVLAAQHSLGLMHDEGVGFPKDKLKATYWYKRAADNGSGYAANNLANLYSKGDRIPLNEKLAEMYWKIAVEDKNVNAAYSLHLYYLREMEPQLAKSYFNTAIELGHDRLRPFKTIVFERIKRDEKIRLEYEGKIKAFEKANKLSAKGLTFSERIKRHASITAPGIANIMDDLDKLRVAENCAPQRWPGKVKSQVDINELFLKAEQGSQTAEKVIVCLENRFHFLQMWEKGTTSRVEIQELISTLYMCLTTAAHHLKLEKETHLNVLKFTNKLFQSIGGKKGTLDMQLRLCLSFLHFPIGGADELHAEVLEEGLRRYPDEISLYRNLADAYGNLKKYSESIQVATKGLLKAPNDPDLLYVKAVHLRLMDRYGVNQLKIREAYKEFVDKAPGDHRKLPDGYYAIALTYVEMDAKESNYSGEMLHYFELGEEAEKLQLSCYLPYDSTCKLILKPIIMVMRNQVIKLSGNNCKNANENGGISESNLYLKNPKRIGMIIMHKEMAKSRREEEEGLFRITMSKIPKLGHKVPKSLTGLQDITLQEMNPTKDKIYEGRILNLTLIEEPNFGLPSIHSIAKDDNGDATRLYIYNVEQDEQARKTFGVGAKISVINPYMRIGSQDLTNGIRVDDPKCFIRLEGVEDMCRYCVKEGARSTCSRCKKAKYCGKKCQEMDWNVLKHKLICLKWKEN